jgi:hypothetical protein
MGSVFKTLRRWAGAATGGQWAGVQRWAEDSGHQFKRVRSGDGFAVEGSVARGELPPWRLEWGPSQRSFLEGQELRIRMELRVHEDVQLLVLSHGLLRRMESATFANFTDSLKTYADDGVAPEEMRWLAMFAKVNMGELPELKPHFGAVASDPKLALNWLRGPLSQQLLRDLPASVSGPGSGLQMMVHRGRLTLRAALAQAEMPALESRLALFAVAAVQLQAALRRPGRG